MGRSLLPKRCAAGWRKQEPIRSTSSPVRPGRTATAKASTPNSDEFLNGEIFYSLKEVKVLTERWRVYYNTERPHSSLGYRPPAPAAWQTEASPRYGKVESKQRFPLSHTADYGDGQLSPFPVALH